MRVFGTLEGFEVLINQTKVPAASHARTPGPLISLTSPTVDPFPWGGGLVAMCSLPGSLSPPCPGPAFMTPTIQQAFTEHVLLWVLGRGGG